MSLQASANASTQVGQLRSLQSAVNASPLMQRKANIDGGTAPVQRKENNTGLPDALKSGIENLSGMRMDDVKVHFNSSKPSQIQAHAYTQGTDIHVAPGQEQHLAHEAWHVVQQKQGRVAATRQLKGINLNDDADLEREADVMGAKAMQMKSGEGEAGALKTQSTTSDTAQRVGKVGEAPESFKDQLITRLKLMWREAALPDDDACKFKVVNLCIQMRGDARVPDGEIKQIGELVQAAIWDSTRNFSPDPITFMQTVLGNLATISGRIGNPYDFGLLIKYIESKLTSAFTNWIKESVQAQEIADLKSAMDELRIPWDKAGPEKFQLMAENFEANSKVNVSQPFVLHDRKKARLVQELKKMPTVKSILSGEISELNKEKIGKHTAKYPQLTSWINPEIVERDKGAMNSEVVGNIRAAMAQIVNMVDPRLLSGLPVPSIVLHKNGGLMDAVRKGNLSDWKKYRANSSRRNIQIDLAENESVAVVVHEIGHQLEYFLGTEHWMNIQKLIRGRHAQSGQANLKSIYPKSMKSENRAEACYQSSQPPVTGDYSMKHYMGGATEVFSMTMEYFSSPKKALSLIEEDPIQALIILDAIAPGDVGQHLSINFQDLLPNRFQEMEDM